MQAIKPNLFIPGAAKSGTTSLHTLLDLHPDICMSSTKEPVYWNNANYKDLNKVSRYNDLFKNKNAKIIGESTTSYMYFPEFISRVNKDFNVVPKFIFILRNPIDRCYSHFWYLKGRGQEKRDFKTSLTNDKLRDFATYGYLPNYYYHFGRYAFWLQKFHNNFESENIKIITLEELKTDPLTTINNCFAFLGLSELDSIPENVSNKTKKLKRPKLYHFIRKTLAGKYSLTKIAKYILPKKQRERLKNKLNSSKYINDGELLNYPKLNFSDRKWIKSLYLEDVNKLKELTGLSFTEWADFND
ncbi:MAG: hypothetical protein DA407_04435 [Bacteroidetes bacterium]|nr:MAG: hypothetical protein DA407_04435 [Bacteroidota bacterium]